MASGHVAGIVPMERLGACHDRLKLNCFVRPIVDRNINRSAGHTLPIK